MQYIRRKIKNVLLLESIVYNYPSAVTTYRINFHNASLILNVEIATGKNKKKWQLTSIISRRSVNVLPFTRPAAQRLWIDMILNHTCWDASCTVRLPIKRQGWVKVDWHELLCLGSPTVYNLRPSTCDFASCDRILQRVYCADQGILRAVRSLLTKTLRKRWADLSCLESNKCLQIKDYLVRN